MDLPISCREIFLEGVTDVYFHYVAGAQLPIPPGVAKIQKMDGCRFTPAAFHISISDEGHAVADSISAKTTVSENGNGSLYAIEINANIIAGEENAREFARKRRYEVFYPVLKKADGSLILAYTLPGSFLYQVGLTFSTTACQATIQSTLKSMSDFIPITLSE